MEAIPSLSINDNGYIGAVHIVDGTPEYWIGMFFPANTDVPHGFEYVDIEPLNYAVFYLYGRENSSEFYTMDTHKPHIHSLEILS